MTRSYSLDLRERVARFVEGGGSCHAAAAHFGVSVSLVVKLMAGYRQTGSLKAKPGGGWRYSKLDPHAPGVSDPPGSRAERHHHA